MMENKEKREFIFWINVIKSMLYISYLGFVYLMTKSFGFWGFVGMMLLAPTFTTEKRNVE